MNQHNNEADLLEPQTHTYNLQNLQGLALQLKQNPQCSIIQANRVFIEGCDHASIATLMLDGSTGLIADILVHDTLEMKEQTQKILTGQGINFKDYGNNFIIPGIIDVNVSLQEFRENPYEGYLKGTEAACAGGITTIFDKSIMRTKKRILTNTHELARTIDDVKKMQLFVDVGLIAQIDVNTVENTVQLAKTNQVFGFCTSFDPCLNKHIPSVKTRKQFKDIVKSISEVNDNLVVLVEPTKSQERFLYARSPFRQEKKRMRIDFDIPESINLMSFAFPEDSKMGDGDSSVSEDDMELQPLSKEKITVNANDDEQAQQQASLLDQKQQQQQDEDDEYKEGLESSMPNILLNNNLNISLKIATRKINISKIANQRLELDSPMIANMVQQMKESPAIAESEIYTYSSSLFPIQENENPIIEDGESPMNQARKRQPQQKSRKESDHVPEKKYDTIIEKKDSNPSQFRSQTFRNLLQPQQNQKIIEKEILSSPSIDSTHNATPVFNDDFANDADSAKNDPQVEETREDSASNKARIQKESSDGDDLSFQEAVNSHSTCASPYLKQKKQLLSSVKSPGIPLQRENSFSKPTQKQSLNDMLCKRSSQNSLFARRKKLMEQKGQSFKVEDQSQENVQKVQEAPTEIAQVQVASQEEVKIEKKQSLQLGIQRIQTKKSNELSSYSQDELHQKYKFYLSLSHFVFEEKGVEIVQKTLKSLNYKCCKIHFYSVSSSAGIHKIHQLQKAPELSSNHKRVTCETNPYLLFTNANDINDGNTLFKCIPPIRDQREQDLTLKIFNRGYFDIISSNHFPVHPSFKHNVDDNFFKAMPGIASLGLTLPLLWTIFKQQQLNGDSSVFGPSMTDEGFILKLIEMCCKTPARIMGVDSVKGSIKVGMKADLAIFNPDEEYQLAQSDIKYKYPQLCPYINSKLRGRVMQTYLTGTLVFQHLDIDDDLFFTNEQVKIGKLIFPSDFN